MNKQNKERKHRKERDSVCSLCGSQFSFFFKDPTKVYTSRCPAILKCGHSICVACLRTTTLRSSSIKCPVCTEVSETEKSKDLREQFPINVYAVGQVFVNLTTQPKDAAIEFCSSKKKMALQNAVPCVECGKNPSDWTCRQCNAQMCNPCFDKLHSVGITLRKHEKVRIDDTNQSIVCDEAMCKDHPGSVCEYYCENCSKYICDTCLRKEHLKHSCVDVFEKNKEIIQEFTEALNEAKDVLKALQTTQKTLQNTEIKSNDKETYDVEKQVSMHFSYLHAILQLREEYFIKEIKSAQGQTRNSVANVMIEVDNNIKEMKSIITQSKAALDENCLSSIPICGILEKLKNITAMPCHLIKNDCQENAKIEFSTDPNITKLLQDHCTLVLPSKKTYELCSKFELPDSISSELLEIPSDKTKNQDLENVETVFESVEKVLSKTMNSTYSNLPPTEIKTKKLSYQEVLRKNRLSLQNKTSDTSSVTSSERKNKISVQNKSTDVISVTSSDCDIESLCSISPLTAGTTEVVSLCHLVSPYSFYVQRKQAKKLLEKLGEHFSKQANIKRQPPENIEKGKMYLVLFATDKKWYRGTVKKVNEANNYEVFYVDYGNTETVHISNIREVPQNYNNIPGQAIHCCLHGCVSVEDHWSEDALNLMTSMTIGVDFSMYIEKIKSSLDLPNTYEVHLRSVDDTILSVADVLIYLGYAQLAERTNTEEDMYKNLFSNITTNMKTYFTDVGIVKGETFDAQITHINTPSNFYIQKISDGGQQLIELMKDLKLMYSTLGPNDQLVLSPVAGLPVAAKFKDGEWYRGVVLQVARACCVQIQYVDFGNIECVNWIDIRTLHPKFLRKNIQGIKCALSDISPKNQKGWSVPAKKAFENMAKKKTLFRVFVDKVEPSQLDIVLYEIQRNKDICFNGLLVKEGYAVSVGPSSVRAEYLHEIDHLGEEDCASSISIVSNSQNQESSHGSIKYLNFEGIESLLSENNMNEAFNSMKKTESSLNIDGTTEEASRVKVKVLKIVTPGEIYLTFSDTYKKILEQTATMTKFYNSTEEEDRPWKVGDMCAVLRLKDRKWHRGVIKNLSSNRYKVFIKDIVDIVEVDKSGLRSLDLRFVTLMDGSLKCHLSGIIPASGTKTWPQYAVEHLKLLATEPSTDYFINQMGEIVGDSIPVQFWKKKVIVGGALEPSKEEWQDLSRALIDVGYVLPDVKSKHYQYMKNHFEVTQKKTVIDWLQQSYEIAAQSPFVTDLEKDIASEKAADDSKSIREDSFDDIIEWKPAEPFKKLDFIANPSYVDFECAIYLQDTSCQATLDLIQRALSTLFTGSVPKPHDLVWSKGQVCIAYYDVDGRWYRGKVTKVTPEHIEVYFVDYGNTEFVQPEDLRKQVTLGKIPIQCHRCLMEGIIPVSVDGRWLVKALDFIHASIVTQECRVNLNPPSSTNKSYTIKDLILPSSQSLMDILVSMHFATYVVNCNELGKENNGEEEEIALEPEPTDFFSIVSTKSKPKSVTKFQSTELCLPDNFSDVTYVTTPIAPETHFQPIIDWYDMPELAKQDLETSLSYKDFVLPDSVVELNVEITVVTTSTTLRVIIINCDDPEVMSQIREFQRVQSDIQEDAETMPAITKPRIGLPCIGCYSEDNSWYRAIITDVDNNTGLVSVYYVDYGNDEKVPVNQLREIKDEWIKIPMLCLQVVLYNVCKGPEFDQVSFKHLMTSCLMSPPYTMTIEARQPLQVELFNSNGEIAYQSVINLGLLSKLTD